MEIRKAQITDSETIHRLSGQLGYSANLEMIKSNIEGMLSHPDYELVVAVDSSGQVLGWMSLAVRLRIEDVSFLQVAALVTDEQFRRQGIGRRLMSYALELAEERRLTFVGLYSRKSRTDAHNFYERLGYAKSKESFFFRRDLHE